LKEKLVHFNYEKLEYLGDVIANLSTVKKYYMVTMLEEQDIYRQYFAPGELHNLKAIVGGNPYQSF
jgi:dsRNA-specific ribonuclease